MEILTISQSIINNLHYWILILFGIIGSFSYYLGKNPYFKFNEINKTKNEIMVEGSLNFIQFILFSGFPLFRKYNVKKRIVLESMYFIVFMFIGFILIIKFLKINSDYFDLYIFDLIFFLLLSVFFFVYFVLSIYIFKFEILFKENKYNIKLKKEILKKVYILNDKDNNLIIQNKNYKIKFISKNDIKEIEELEI
jgi:hypothetical protein